MTRLTQLYDLLTEHGGTLSYAALAGMMDIRLNRIIRIMVIARREGWAENVNAHMVSRPNVARLIAGARSPTPVRGGDHVPHPRRAEVLALLGDASGGLSLTTLAIKLYTSTRTLRPTMQGMVQMGEVVETVVSGRGHKRYTLPQAAPVTPCPALPRSVLPPASVGLTGELGAARKLVAGLTIKSARGLACAGNYKLSRADELFAQLKAGGWL